MITVENVTKIFRMGQEKIYALDNVSFKILKGKSCAIVGTSGSGKSTMLNLLAGLERPTEGNIMLGNLKLQKMSETQMAIIRQKYVGFVFQSYNLLSSLTALENVSLPLVFQGVPKKKREREATKMLELVGLKDRLRHKPNELSGGQQQRVSIARALVNNPKIVFADEPTGNLDSKTTSDILNLISEITSKNNQTLVVVSHDKEMLDYADLVIELKDGKIISMTA